MYIKSIFIIQGYLVELPKIFVDILADFRVETLNGMGVEYSWVMNEYNAGSVILHSSPGTLLRAQLP